MGCEFEGSMEGPIYSRMEARGLRNFYDLIKTCSGGEETGMKTEGASFTQRTISSISVGGSIISEGFLSSILLVVVIIVMVVIVVVILIVIVVAIVGVVIVVMIFGVVVVFDDVSLIFKLSFVERMNSTRALSVKVPVANVTLFSSAQLLQENTDSVCSNQRMRSSSRSGVPVGITSTCIVSACAFRAEEMPSVISCWMAAKVMAGVSNVNVLLGALRGYGMIYNDRDGDNTAYDDDRDDDEREISWYYETTR
ncbi:hypothetical protein Tco_0127820 [Tanacetum coccineum]